MHSRPLRRVVATMSAAVLAVAALAACSGGSGGAGGEDGDSLVLAWSSTPSQLDPNVFTGLTWIYASDAHMATLLDYGLDVPDDEIIQVDDVVPGLAESWEPNEDKSQYTFTLRQGVMSPYGNELTADDVIYSFDRMLSDPKTLASSIFFPTANVDKSQPWTKIDDYTLTYNLTAPSAISLSILTYPALGILDSTEVQKHATDADPWASEWLASNTASFDMYTLKSLEPENEIRYEPNPNYYGGEPEFDEIIIRAVPDGSSRVQLLVSGEVDMIDQPPLDQLTTIDDSSNAFVSAMPDLNRHNLTFNGADPIMGDPAVRAAISKAIDREAIVETIYQGYAEPALTPQASGILADQPTIGEYDPEAAQAELADAGYPDGFTMQLAYNAARPGPYAENMARLIQSDLAEIGVTVNLQAVPALADFEAGVTAKQYQSYLYTERPSQPDVVFGQFAYLFGSSSLNKSGYQNAEFDRLTTEALALAAGAERDEAIEGALELLATDQPIAQLVEVNDVVGISNRISGYRAVPTGGVPFRAITKE